MFLHEDHEGPEYSREIQEYIEREIARRSKEDPQFVIQAYQQELAKREAELEAVQPKAEFYDTVTETEDWMEMSAAVKLLGYQGWGRNNTFKFLRDRGVLRYNNEPKQRYVENGYFKTVEQHFSNPKSGEVMINRKTVVSQRGLDFIRRMLSEEG